MELDALGSEGTVEGRLACVDSGMVRISHSLSLLFNQWIASKALKKQKESVPLYQK